MIKEIWILDKCKTRTGKGGPKAYLTSGTCPAGVEGGVEGVIEPPPSIFILPLMLPLVCVPSKVTKTSQGFHFSLSGEIAFSLPTYPYNTGQGKSKLTQPPQPRSLEKALCSL